MDGSITSPMERALNVTTNIQPNISMSQTHAAIFSTLTITTMMLGIVGNLMVFLAVALSKGLQNSINVFVVNLSISDFISAIILLFQAAALLFESEWPFSKGLCDLAGALILWTSCTSILTLTAIAVNRYIVITKTKRLQQRIYTRRGNTLMVALLWMFPFLVLVIPQLIPATGGIVYDPIFRTCIWDSEHPLATVFQRIAMVNSISCTVIIVFCYTAIYCFVRRHVKRTLRNSSEIIEMEDRSNKRTSPRGPSINQIKITKNLALVVLVVFICNLPFALNLSVKKFGVYSVYLALLAILPFCLNPMIYAARHPQFQVVFKCMLFCRFRDVPHPSEWLKALLRTTGSANRATRSSPTI
ncbi:rhodopsin, GQ-coupled-like [Lytechinus variegatus]|uniref:rhodopsin, GQ-coupled-like n=1 Tax=Lytechinus variegatus TaxID=7654 RepID=UPI001BB1BF6B|nr:rhodopsin, GQ-coupled-like [Lytechinus variegatus]